MRMPDTCISKQVFCGQLAEVKRLPGGRHKRYQDGLKQNLKTPRLPEDLGDLIATTSLTTSEATRVGAIQAKQQARKTDNHHPEHWTVGM